MKKLPLQNASFRYLIKSFAEWLDIQGYAPSTTYILPIHIRELLHFLEANNILHIKSLNQRLIKNYYHSLKVRSNHKQGGGLSNAHLNKHIQSLRKFTEYLRKVGRLDIPAILLANESTDPSAQYLTKEEVSSLFLATQNKTGHQPNGSPAVQEALRARDQAMLAVYYGCGLRRSEGVALDIGDINFDRSVLLVRKGKNHKERLVPISKANLQFLQSYRYDHRHELTQGSNTQALFISYQHHKRMHGQSLFVRLKRLQYYSDDPDLQQKEIGLHTLRHSIATHLLQAGMPLESISRFLGHGSLESTQIYTHLAEIGQAYPSGRQASLTGRQAFNNIHNYEPIQLSEDEKGL